MFRRVFKSCMVFLVVCSLLSADFYMGAVQVFADTLDTSLEATDAGGLETTTENIPDSEIEEITSEADTSTNAVEVTEEVTEETESVSDDKDSHSTEIVDKAQTESEESGIENTEMEAVESETETETETETEMKTEDADSDEDTIDNSEYEYLLHVAVSEKAYTDEDLALLSEGDNFVESTGISGSQILSPSSATVNEVIEIVRPIIYTNELGSNWSQNYGGVNVDDNGAISVGLLQWHGTRAQSLLQSIVNSDSSANTTLNIKMSDGTTLYNYVLNGTT